MDVEIESLKGQFIGIQKQAVNLINDIKNDIQELRNFMSQTDAVVAGYNDARVDFNHFMQKNNSDVLLREISYNFSFSQDNCLSALRFVMIHSSKALGALNMLSSPLTIEQANKLESLKDELKKLTPNIENINYEKNLSEAIEEFEKGHFLASALISSKVILYSLEQIKSGDINEVIEHLVEKKILKEKGIETKEFILKANKKARNYFTHDINVFPKPSDVLSLLGDSMKILEILIKLK